MFVLGIDPGVSRCGFGAVRRDRAGLRAEQAGVLTTPPDDPLPHRLAALAALLDGLLTELRPDAVVVERVFFQTNVRTAMSVGQASGLALAAAAGAGCEVVQYTANEVKQAVTGYGAATKDQVQRMVQAVLRLPETPRPPDAADALALAVCHLTLAPRLARIEEAATRHPAQAAAGRRPATRAATAGATRAARAGAATPTAGAATATAGAAMPTAEAATPTAGAATPTAGAATATAGAGAGAGAGREPTRAATAAPANPANPANPAAPAAPANPAAPIRPPAARARATVLPSPRRPGASQ